MNRKENLLKIQEQIARAAEKAGRHPDEIKLVAVSKIFGVDDIREVYNLGQRDFAESRPQELRDKVGELAQDINWHFIGPLQTNKIKYVIPSSLLIHAVDSFKLARAIAEHGKKKNVIPRILLEINSSGEEAKQGFSLDKAVEACLEIDSIENLSVNGLMTMAPYSDDINWIRKSFRAVKKIQEEIQKQLGNDRFSVLSMGMSSDFEYAIEEGSTIVRIGTAIFGPRRR